MNWSKIQELHSSQTFVVIPKNLKILKRENAAGVVHGTVTERDQQVKINTVAGSSQTLSAGAIRNLVPEAEFEKAFERTNLLHGWKGGATAGLLLTEATQKNQSFTAAVSLVRAVPAENWLDLRSRTIFDYTQAYGKVRQPNTPVVKTSPSTSRWNRIGIPPRGSLLLGKVSSTTASLKAYNCSRPTLFLMIF